MNKDLNRKQLTKVQRLVSFGTAGVMKTTAKVALQAIPNHSALGWHVKGLTAKKEILDLGRQTCGNKQPMVT